MQTETRELTVDEWLVQDIPEGFRAELIEGVLEKSPLAANRHQRVLHKLIEEIVRFKIFNPGIVAWWASPCRFPVPRDSKNRGREPDLGLYDRDPHDPDAPTAWKDLLPIVVAEIVSPDPVEAYRDHVDKREDYHTAGIPEYWIVDYGQKLFLALRRTEHGWDEYRLRRQETYVTPLLPGFQLSIAQLWT